MPDLPPIEKVIESLNRNVIPGRSFANEHKDLNEMLGILGPHDDYIMAIGMAPNGYLGILLGYAIAKAEE